MGGCGGAGVGRENDELAMQFSTSETLARATRRL